MQIGSQFPALQPRVRPTTALVPAFEAKAASQRSFVSPSPQASFASFADVENQARFSRMAELDKFTQSALAAYQQTESLSLDNPRNYLIGVDVFA